VRNQSPTSVDLGSAENDVVAAAMSFTAAFVSWRTKDSRSTDAEKVDDALLEMSDTRTQLIHKCRALKKLQRVAGRNK